MRVPVPAFEPLDPIAPTQRPAAALAGQPAGGQAEIAWMWAAQRDFVAPQRPGSSARLPAGDGTAARASRRTAAPGRNRAGAPG